MNLKSQEATNQLQDYLKRMKAEVVRKRHLPRTTTLHEMKKETKDLERWYENGAQLDYLEKERGFSCIPHVFYSINQIEFFMSKGRDINSQDENGDTALHLTLRYFSSETDRYIIKFLLEQSADPNIANFRGETALFTVAWNQISEDNIRKVVAEMLLEKGADLGTRNNDGQSVLHQNHITDWFIEKLERNHVNIKTSDWLYSQTPLMIAIKNSRLKDCSRMLIQRGADVNVKDLQGYTALHHSLVFNRGWYSKILYENGADPNAVSESGKDAYELAIQGDREFPFLHGAVPKKQLELFELAGARDIMMYPYRGYEVNWKKGMDMCEKFSLINLKPSPEFVTNYNFIREHPDMIHANYIAAMKTVARVSKSDGSKFWNLLSFTPTNRDRDSSWYVFETLNFLKEEFKRVADFASLEENDFLILSKFGTFFEEWLRSLTYNRDERNKSELTLNSVIHFQAMVSLVIACFEKRVQVTKSKMITCMDLYVTFVKVLNLVRNKLNTFITAEAFIDNERLLKSMIDLDLRDRNGNTFLHIVLADFSELNIGSIDSYLDFGNVTAINQMNLEPVQMIQWKYRTLPEFRKLAVKMANRGAHLDARNYKPGDCNPSLKKILEMEPQERYSSLYTTSASRARTLYLYKAQAFTYDTLQCMCARVLARSLVPFRNRVPKRMVDFILMH